MPKLSILKEYTEEKFLLSLTNRGIYNRAVKDFENIKDIKIEESEDKIKVSFKTSSEDVNIFFTDDIKETVCSCPSSNFCKHIVIGLLYIKKYAESLKDGEKKDDDISNNNFSELKNISMENIKKLSSKKNFEYALNEFEECEIKIIETDNMLEISILEKNITVYFPKIESVKNSICSCKYNGLCVHKIIAILKYKEIKGKLEDFFKGFREKNKIIDEDILRFSKKFIENIFEKGFYSCGERDFDTAERIAVKLYVKNMPKISKNFRTLASNIENMIRKRASFNKVFAFENLSKIYNCIKAVEKAKEEKDNKTLKLLTGETRNKYMEVSSGEFIGLGAYPWRVSSGYCGISSYLYDINSKKIFSFSYAIPTFYENSKISYEEILNNYTKKIHWSENISIEEISKYKIKLINYKINGENRISSSKKTSAILNERIDSNFFKNIRNLELFIADYESIENTDFKYDYFNDKSEAKIFITEFQRIENINFDKINQTLFFDIVKESKDRLTLNIRYNPLNSAGMNYIKNYKNSEIDKNRFIVIEKTKYFVRPISVINSNALINVFFEN